MNKHMRFVLLLAAVAFVAILLPHGVHAACPDGSVEVSNSLSSDAISSNNCIGSSHQNPIFALLGKIIQLMTALIGIVMVLMLVIAGLQYVISGSSPDTAKDAKKRIENAFIGLILFILMFGILQVILPPDAKIFQT